MPAAQLIFSALEGAVNKLLSMDPEAQQLLQPLQSRQLKVTLTESPWPMVFSFSDKVYLLADTDQNREVDCEITLSAKTLSKLKDSSQLTRLIQQGELSLDGDIDVAQHFSHLVNNLNIDWEEQLSTVIGDVPAHTLFSFGQKAFAHARETFERLETTLSEGIVEEKRIAAPPAAVADFNQKVSTTRSDVARLEARISELENQEQ